MKIINDLLRASNNYIAGVEHSPEYKALVKELIKGEDAMRGLKNYSEVVQKLEAIEEIICRGCQEQ